MRRTVLLASLTLSSLFSGEAPVIGAWAVHDPTALHQHWEATPYFKIWSLPQVEKARIGLAGAVATGMADLGFDLWAILRDAAAAQGEVVADAETGGRSYIQVRLPTTAETVWTALSKTGSVDKQGILTFKDMAATRSGDILRFATGGAPREVTPMVKVAPWADYSSRFDLKAMPVQQDQATFDAVLHTLRLSELTLAVGLGADGIRDQVDLGQAKLPVQALDPALLALVPAKALMVAAVGIDGKALVQTIADLAKELPDMADAITDADEGLVAQGLPSTADILGGLHGTMLLMVTPGTPFPTVTIALPRSPSTDALMQSIATQLGTDLSTAGDAAVPMPLPPGLPLPVMPVVRQGTTHWIVSTDQLLPDQMGAGTGGGFDLKAAFADAGAAPVAGLMTMDLPGIAKLIGAYLPLAMQDKRQPAEQKQMLMSIRQGLAAAVPLLPASRTVLLSGARTQIVGRNGSLSMMPIAAGMLLPAITLAREQARRQNSGNQQRQLLLAAVVYSNENDAVWPETLESLIEYHNYELSDKNLVSPLDPTHPNPYLYVRPNPTAPAMQPVIIEDPATSKGKGSMVTFADGHFAWFEKEKAARLWAEAQRLAGTPEAAGDGIRFADWAAVQDLLK